MNLIKKIILYIFILNSTAIFANEKNIITVKETIKNINVSIDPRIEMLSIVQYLADDNTISKEKHPYTDRIEKYFSSLKKHKAVKYYKKLNKREYSYDGPPSLLLHFNNNYDLISPISKDEIRRIGGKRKLRKFITLLKEFKKDSNFNKFYINNIEFYKSILEDYKKNETFDYVSPIENFYQKKQNSYNNILATLYLGNNYGPKIKHNDSFDIYNIMCPFYYNNDIPQFRNIVLFHEFSHSYVNPITKELFPDMKNYYKLFKPLEEEMAKQTYSIYSDTIINEHIVRAVDIYLSKKSGLINNYMSFIKIDENKGFICIKNLIKAIEYYDKNKEKYKNFKEFYPEIIKVFNDYNDLGYEKTIIQSNFSGNRYEFVYNTGDFVLVLPKYEKDKKIQAELRKNAKSYWTKVANSVGKNIEFTDGRLFKERIYKDYNVIVYGNSKTNKYLEKLEKNMDIKLKEDKVSIKNRDILGDDLILATSIQHPLNKKRGILILESQNSKDLIDIESIPKPILYGKNDILILNSENKNINLYK